MDQNLTKVEAMSVEWMGKLTALENKVAGLESIKSAWSEDSARAAALENIISVFQSEQESERAKTTLMEARLEERISEVDQEASVLEDRVAALEVENEQLLMQIESSSTAVPPYTRALGLCRSPWDIYKSLWEEGIVTEAAYEEARVKEREARINCGYDAATPEANGDADDGNGRLLGDGDGDGDDAE
ncbi:uncharacterized protein LOC107827629 [Nicotiana tabacum]|uniref:Uncharacterized protein LOC107827629 n=1 Tax=Nicotiana tabacum TaxID=4097 RepID=A0AC58TV73_TOBAC